MKISPTQGAQENRDTVSGTVKSGYSEDLARWGLYSDPLCSEARTSKLPFLPVLFCLPVSASFNEYKRVDAGMYVCAYLCLSVCLPACAYACMYVCKYAFMHACM